MNKVHDLLLDEAIYSLPLDLLYSNTGRLKEAGQKRFVKDAVTLSQRVYLTFVPSRQTLTEVIENKAAR
jgi:hypothetical protein